MILEKETFESLGKTFEEAGQKYDIWCQCDYCGEKFPRLKHNIIRSWKIVKTDSCSKKVCVQKKRIESNKVIFGTENPFQNKEIKQKIAKKNLENFGVENPFQNKEIQEKQKKTCMERYNVENVFQSEHVKKKIKSVMNKKYGVDNPFQHPEFQKKQKSSLMKKYGVAYALQDPELRKKAIDTCVANFGYFPANNYGKTQREIMEWLNSIGGNFKNDRTLIVGKEIDLYDENKKLAIEYCGLHWHNEMSPEPRNHKYHFSKFKSCLDQDVQLLTIFSDEWETRQSQCKSHIKSILGACSSRLYGRKCNVIEIDRKIGQDFFEQYHIQGKNSLGIVFFGLYSDQDLVGAMSLGRHNRQCNSIVLDRLCFKDGVQVIGGASKLFSRCVEWAKQHSYSQILSFSDNRWSIGKVYSALNFRLDKEGKPDYSYVNIKQPNQRLSKQSQKKQNTNCPKELTEYEWAKVQGLARIWDCGKKRWIFDV